LWFQQKLIVELVRIQNDGTVEVIDNGTPVSELWEFEPTKGQSTITYEKSLTESFRSIPRLKIAILVVGTRGDVQPFLAMAKRLQVFVKVFPHSLYHIANSGKHCAIIYVIFM